MGDSRCKFDLNQANFTVNAVVNSQQSFVTTSLTQANNWFTYGYALWQSGKNIGLKMEVKSFYNSVVTLVLPMAFEISTGDEFTIIAGCDKASRTCIEKFNNIINFRGELDIQGIDKLAIY